MKNFVLLISFFTLSSKYCLSQEKPAAVTTVTKATFLNPGISYEKGIGKNQTVYLQGFLNTSAEFVYSSEWGASSDISFDPAFTLQYRYYYNIPSRQAKGKRVEMNSANYISPVFQMSLSKEYVSEVFAKRNPQLIYQFAAVWGLQRNFAKRFSLDLNIAPGILFTKQVSENIDTRQPKFTNLVEYSTFSQVNLGFWLNRRK